MLMHRETTRNTPKDALRSLLHETMELTASLEQGKARRPLEVDIENALANLEGVDVRIVVVALEPESAAAIANLLVQCPLVDQQMTEGFDRIWDLTLGAEQWSWTFEGKESVAENETAWRESLPSLASASKGVLSANVAIPDRVDGVQLVLAPNLASCQSAANQLSHFLSQASLLVVVGRDQAMLDSAAAEMLRDLSAVNTTACWIVLDADDYDQRREHWSRYAPVDALAVSRQAEPNENESGALVVNGSPIRLSLRERECTRRFERRLEMLRGRISNESARERGKRKLAAQQAARRITRDDGMAREASSGVRRIFENHSQQVDAETSDRLRDRTLPTAKASNLIDNLLEDLSVDEIRETIVKKSIQLAVDDRFSQRAEEMVGDLVHEAVEEDTQYVNDRLESLSSAIQSQLTACGVRGDTTRPELIHADDLWDAVRPMVHVDPRYHGELPRRTWIDRISHGRRPVFAVMIMASLFGAAFGIRNGLMAFMAPVLLVLFTSGIIWTFRSFRDEREQRLRRELQRLRDSLTSSINRVHEQALRQAHSLLARQFRDASKQLERISEDTLQDFNRRKSELGEARRRELAERIQRTDTRIRDLSRIQTRLGKTKSSVQTLLASFQDLPEHVRSFFQRGLGAKR